MVLSDRLPVHPLRHFLLTLLEEPILFKHKEDVDGQFAPGLLVYGVPVGSDLYVTKMLDKKVQEIEANADKAIELLSHDKQALWTVVRSSIQHQFDYWLMLVPVSYTHLTLQKIYSV